MLNDISLVFSTLNNKLLAANQPPNLATSTVTVSCSEFKFWSVQEILVSSAKRVTFPVGQKEISLMYIKKSNGPKMLPCGTPFITSIWLD